jgi:hypothetical protein
VGAVSALVLAAVSIAGTRTTVWTAALSSGQEVPKQVVKNTAAHGLFKGTLKGSKTDLDAHLNPAVSSGALRHFRMSRKVAPWGAESGSMRRIRLNGAA